MLIELHRKEVAADYSVTNCVICGDDFELGSVFCVAYADQGEDLGEMCPTCLEYLNRRKADADNPDRGNWPASGWPTSEDFEEARRRHPSPMFETSEDLLAVARGGREAEEKLYADTIVWEMNRASEVRGEERTCS